MPPPDPRTMVVLLCGDTEVAAWVLEGSDHPDLAVVDEVARAQLEARRLGCSIQLHDASPCLCQLLDLAGLTSDVVERRGVDG